MKLKSLFIVSLLAGAVISSFNSCKPELNELTFSNNGVDFSKYVAIGNSLTAGYMDGALYLQGQENSYPSILARQFSFVGGGEFKQPLFNSSIGFAINTDPMIRFDSRYILGFKNSCTGATSLSPVLFAASADSTFFNYIGAQGPYNNMGVPGMKSFDLDSAEFGSPFLNVGNSFYSRFATSPDNSTVLSDAKRQLPTFFTFSLGANDVLGYALAGGDALIDKITTKIIFENNINPALASLAENGTKGAVANIPSVVDIPYFNTIPYNALVLTQEQADQLNFTYAASNPPISFVAGNNALVIKDLNASPDFKRQLKPTELVLLSLPLDSVYCEGWGSNSLKPLEDKFVLTENEIREINNATTQFNGILQSQATLLDLAYVDLNAFFKSTQGGLVFNGVTFTPEFVSGGAFSLDGVHPNAKGYALIANEYIKAINNKYGCRIPLADVNAYSGNVFP